MQLALCPAEPTKKVYSSRIFFFFFSKCGGSKQFILFKYYNDKTFILKPYKNFFITNKINNNEKKIKLLNSFIFQIVLNLYWNSSHEVMTYDRLLLLCCFSNKTQLSGIFVKAQLKKCKYNQLND